MTVSSKVSSIIYNGNASTRTFDVPFRFLEDSDLQLSIQDSLGNIRNLVLNSDYTVSGAGQDNGGSVTLNAAVGTGSRLSILRIMDLLQETDYRENERFPAESHERALDKLTFEVQQCQEQLDRAIVVDVFSEVTADELRQHVERVWESCDNIDTLVADKANMDTVARNITSVNATGLNIQSVVTTANNMTSVNTNANNISQINTVAGSISSVNNLAPVAEDIAAVSEIKDSVVATANNNTDISTVADISEDVRLVADNINNLERINFGLRTIEFHTSDWVRVGSIYQMQYNKNDLAVSIYKFTGTGSELVVNVSIKRLDNINVLFSQAPFDGYMLVAGRQEDNTYTFEFNTASYIWVINHNLHRYPSVTLVDEEGNEFEKRTVYNSPEQCTCYMNSAKSGKAYLN